MYYIGSHLICQIDPPVKSLISLSYSAFFSCSNLLILNESFFIFFRLTLGEGGGRLVRLDFEAILGATAQSLYMGFFEKLGKTA